MRKSDRVLIGIVAGIILVVVVGFIIASTWSEPEYKTGGLPEDIAYNYFLALQKEEIGVAYSLISPHIDDYPSLSQFKANHMWIPYILPDGTVQVVSAEINNSIAHVSLRINDSRDFSFLGAEYQSDYYTINLRYEDFKWRITGFGRCWDC